MKKTQAESLKNPPLNTLIAFSAASRRGSLTLAAAEMHLTPGAVSRQVKQLEDALGVTLFHRSHNAITLTDAGQRFLTYVNAALAMLETGARGLNTQRSRLVIQAPITLARRWLIPRIGSFRQENPTADLVIQSLALGSLERPDLTITYRRSADAAEVASAFLLDRTMAVCSPKLIAGSRGQFEASDILELPILLDTADAWSWRCWCNSAGLTFEPRGGSIAFDTDEASIDACISGLGVGQASPLFIEHELRSGQLVALTASVAPVVGAYDISKPVEFGMAGIFLDWLEKWTNVGAE
ncbi:LysR family transcriptional regulator [Ensifer adhaerens]|uniref:LysR family transcriptional regulator n=1 Tax=Ensifer adhaerens TaxID=106592 RepID=A0A0L8BZZ2_ENSAD|nr:LysR family transcriptional regulator [Ensifer adhaerens]KOF20153.1 LysR family transcriptional regulator [Ensifer adhaerens]